MWLFHPVAADMHIRSYGSAQIKRFCTKYEQFDVRKEKGHF
jgi:hypothetical protein